MNKERITEYLVKFDGDAHLAFSSLREARQYVRDIPVKISMSEMPENIQIVKSVTVFTVINEYEPKPSVVLCASETFDDIDLA